MTYERLPYDEASSPTEMASDCRAVGLAMHLPRQATRFAVPAVDTIPNRLRPPPPLRVRRVRFAVSDAAARLAGKLFD